MYMLRKLLIVMGIMMAAAHAGTAVAQTQFDITGEIQAGTCQWAVGDDDVKVTLDPIDASVLMVNGSGGFKAFNLTVENCTPYLTAAVFTFGGGITDPNNPVYLKNMGSAQGVAVALQSADGQTIGANGTHNARTVAIVGNQATLGLQAGYWRVGTGPVTAGSVSASVEVELIYE
jgi:type 1 fimbria pilin